MDIDFEKYDIQFKQIILDNGIVYAFKMGNQIIIDTQNTYRDEMINLFRNGYSDLFDIVEKAI